MFNIGGLRVMGKVIQFEYADVTRFARGLNKKIQSKEIDDIFINSFAHYVIVLF